MVNEDFNKFNKVQHEHEGVYLGSGRNPIPGVNDPEYNNQKEPDKTVGAIGKKIK